MAADIDEGLASRLKEAMDAEGFSQAELGRRLHVTRAAVSNWIKTGTMTRRNLKACAALLNSSYEWLSEGRGPRKPTDKVMSEGIRIEINDLGNDLVRPIKGVLASHPKAEVWRLTGEAMAGARYHPGDSPAVVQNRR